MVALRKLLIHGPSWFFLLAFCWAASPLSAQENPRPDDRVESPKARSLAKAIEIVLETIEQHKAVIQETDRAEHLCRVQVDIAEARRKRTQQILAKATEDPPPDTELAGSIVEDAEIAEAEEKAANKKLAAAKVTVEAAKVGLDELQANLAVQRAELKTLKEPGREHWEVLQAARKRHAMIRLKAAVADQRVAESEVEATEAELAVARKRVTISKARVGRLKKNVEMPGEESRLDSKIHDIIVYRLQDQHPLTGRSAFPG